MVADEDPVESSLLMSSRQGAGVRDIDHRTHWRVDLRLCSRAHKPNKFDAHRDLFSSFRLDLLGRPFRRLTAHCGNDVIAAVFTLRRIARLAEERHANHY